MVNIEKPARVIVLASFVWDAAGGWRRGASWL